MTNFDYINCSKLYNKDNLKYAVDLLRDGQLYFSHYKKFSDSKEFTTSKISNEIIEQQFEIVKENIRVCCLSSYTETFDSFFWDTYASKSGCGIILEIKKSNFHIPAWKVEYSDEEIELEYDNEKKQIFDKSIVQALCTKNTKYSHENEIRLIKPIYTDNSSYASFDNGSIKNVILGEELFTKWIDWTENNNGFISKKKIEWWNLILGSEVHDFFQTIKELNLSIRHIKPNEKSKSEKRYSVI